MSLSTWSRRRCAVCGRVDARRLETLGGSYLGTACDGECTGLLWESHLVRALGGGPEDVALVLWSWQRRCAEVHGRLVPPRPTSSGERAVEAWVRRCGLEDVARELES